MDSDPDWLRTVTQLAQLDRDLADAATLLVSTGLAVKRILEVIDGVAEPSEIQYRYDRKSSTLSQATLTALNCGCR